MNKSKYYLIDKQAFKILESYVEKHYGQNEESKLYLYYAGLFLSTFMYIDNWNNKAGENEELIRKRLKNMDAITGRRNITDTVVEILVYSDLVYRDKFFIPTEKSKGYKPKIKATAGYRKIYFDDYMNFSRRSRYIKRIQSIEKKYDSINWHRDNLCKNLKMDYQLLQTYLLKRWSINIPAEREKALEYLEALEVSEEKFPDFNDSELDSLRFEIRKIFELSDLYATTIVKGLKGGRHYHALSNATRGLKACMVSTSKTKKYLWQIDVKNSQPFFLLCLILKHKLEIEEPVKQAILGGMFYELIGEIWGYSRFDIMEDGEERKEVKQKVFRDLFFCQSQIIRENSNGFKAIKKEYPLFADSIGKLSNMEKDKTLASKLQKIETDEIIPLVKKHTGIGIHDAILIIAIENTREIETIKRELSNHFYKKFGITPQVSVDLISLRKD